MHCTLTEEGCRGGSIRTSDEGLGVLLSYRLGSKLVEESCVLLLRECPRTLTRVHRMKVVAKVLPYIS